MLVVIIRYVLVCCGFVGDLCGFCFVLVQVVEYVFEFVGFGCQVVFVVFVQVFLQWYVFCYGDGVVFQCFDFVWIVGYQVQGGDVQVCEYWLVYGVVVLVGVKIQLQVCFDGVGIVIL